MGGAKRHHFIPRFLLRQFSANPTASNPLICRLDKAAGRIASNAISNEAVIGQFNRLGLRVRRASPRALQVTGLPIQPGMPLVELFDVLTPTDASGQPYRKDGKWGDYGRVHVVGVGD